MWLDGHEPVTVAGRTVDARERKRAKEGKNEAPRRPTAVSA